MTLRTSARHGRLIVEMPREVDISNAEPLRQELRDVCRTLLAPASHDRPTAVVVDWSAAPFLTIAGVAVLDDFRRQAGTHGVPVRVVVSRRWPRAVLRMVGLKSLLAIHDTVEQALAGDEPSRDSQGRPETGRATP